MLVKEEVDLLASLFKSCCDPTEDSMPGTCNWLQRATAKGRTGGGGATSQVVVVVMVVSSAGWGGGGHIAGSGGRIGLGTGMFASLKPKPLHPKAPLRAVLTATPP